MQVIRRIVDAIEIVSSCWSVETWSDGGIRKYGEDGGEAGLRAR